MDQRLNDIQEFLVQGGVVIWLIAALSVLTAALILWKLYRLAAMGAWSGRHSRRAVDLWSEGEARAAREVLASRRSIRSRFAMEAMAARQNGALDSTEQREELVRIAKELLASARSGLRPLELIATIAPLLGLLGTVIGMIAAFQALQEAGARADPSALAGGIWEALLTTAAGMAVAIPASMALSWFESVADAIQRDLEDIGTKILTRGRAPEPVAPEPLREAA
ncbi:MAG: MotA/TolQ/ExbB proton channel family protein [Pseudomonadota bacterium]